MLQIQIVPQLVHEDAERLRVGVAEGRRAGLAEGADLGAAHELIAAVGVDEHDVVGDLADVRVAPADVGERRLLGQQGEGVARRARVGAVDVNVHHAKVGRVELHEALRARRHLVLERVAVGKDGAPQVVDGHGGGAARAARDAEDDDLVPLRVGEVAVRRQRVRSDDGREIGNRSFPAGVPARAAAAAAQEDPRWRCGLPGSVVRRDMAANGAYAVEAAVHIVAVGLEGDDDGGRRREEEE